MQAQRMGERMLTTAMRYGQHPIYDAHGGAATDRRASVIFDYRV